MRRYEIHVGGVVPAGVLAAVLEEHPDIQVRTLLHCHIRDQAALHGLLGRLHDLGLDLVALHQISDPTSSSTG